MAEGNAARTNCVYAATAVGGSALAMLLGFVLFSASLGPARPFRSKAKSVPTIEALEMIRWFRDLRSAALALAVTSPILAAGQPQAAMAGELLMLETSYCVECARFKKEVRPGYLASTAGRLLPLRSLDIDKDRIDVALTGPAVMTPTFVFVEHGIEIARLTGYPGRARFNRILNAVAEGLLSAGADQ